MDHIMIIPYRVTSLLGYLPHELIGDYIYQYYHCGDVNMLAEMHKQGQPFILSPFM